MPDKLTMLYPREITNNREYMLCVYILQWWSICYYQGCYAEENMPEVEDRVNDYVYRMVEDWEKANPHKINQWSTTQHVGFGETIDDERKAIIRATYINVQDGLKKKYGIS